VRIVGAAVGRHQFKKISACEPEFFFHETLELVFEQLLKLGMQGLVFQRVLPVAVLFALLFDKAVAVGARPVPQRHLHAVIVVVKCAGTLHYFHGIIVPLPFGGGRCSVGRKRDSPFFKVGVVLRLLGLRLAAATVVPFAAAVAASLATGFARCPWRSKVASTTPLAFHFLGMMVVCKEPFERMSLLLQSRFKLIKAASLLLQSRFFLSSFLKLPAALDLRFLGR
jgi:hypothetical protein